MRTLLCLVFSAFPVCAQQTKIHLEQIKPPSPTFSPGVAYFDGSKWKVARLVGFAINLTTDPPEISPIIPQGPSVNVAIQEITTVAGQTNYVYTGADPKLVFLNGLIQAPSVDFTVNTTAKTVSSNFFGTVGAGSKIVLVSF